MNRHQPDKGGGGGGAEIPEGKDRTGKASVVGGGEGEEWGVTANAFRVLFCFKSM